MGDNLYGQCGVGSGESSVRKPRLLRIAAGNVKCRTGAVACGPRHSCCITRNNQLFAWGSSTHDKLVHTLAPNFITRDAPAAGVAIRSALKDCCYVPRMVYALLHYKVVAAALSEAFTVLVTGDGTNNEAPDGADANESARASPTGSSGARPRQYR
eukprot:GHVU01186143.1.p3 GENE.GHVU01186143.1~~GHVU01186143.1.p3  ORF type:complete len:156 (+),score=32.88 GHVU01186143.1:549-1016(+)